MAYSYFRKFDVLRQILFGSPVVDRLVHETPALRSVRSLDIMVQGLPVLLAAWDDQSDLQGSRRGQRGSTRAGGLRPARHHRAHAQDAVVAPGRRNPARHVPAARSCPSRGCPSSCRSGCWPRTGSMPCAPIPVAEPPRGSKDSNPIRILQKGARYAFTQRLPVQATGILERIKDVDKKAVPAVFDVPTVEAVLGGVSRGRGREARSAGLADARRRHGRGFDRRRAGGERAQGPPRRRPGS